MRLHTGTGAATTKSWRRYVGSAVLSAIGVMYIACGLLPLTAQAQELNAGMQPAELRDVGIDQRLNEQIPLDLTFRDETGKSVQLRQYFNDKPVVLILAYYECPMLCTMVLNGALRAFRALSFDVGDEFQVITVSFDPRETPELAAKKKKSYMEAYERAGAADGWHFLTGDEPAIKALTQAVGFRYKYDPETEQFAHASGIMILTPQGRLSRYFYGIDYGPRDVRLGLVEASEGKIGSPVDAVLLYCFHYDPKTGKYGAVIMNIVRVAGVSTLVILGTFMIVMFRRERRMKVR
ncbi:MAG: SCO family protein [Acidobacteriota bacterium]|nr:SCO family protein [Blastocatellia bacterium]MDW8238566.1 SCO family protein [Acidobacteriota bacterium]